MRPRIPAAKDEQREGAHPKANPKASRRPSEAKATPSTPLQPSPKAKAKREGTRAGTADEQRPTGRRSTGEGRRADDRTQAEAHVSPLKSEEETRAKIIPIDVIKGISGKYGNKSSDYFATNRSSNQIHLAKIVNPYQGPPTEKQKAQQAKFAARQVVSTAWLNANRPSETTGEKGTADYQLVQRMKRQMGLSNINQVLHKYMGEDNIIRLPHGDEFQAPPTQGGGGSSAGGTKRRHTITLTSANPDQGTVSGGGTYDEGAQATIRATPKTGFAFDKWSDSNTQSVRTLTVNADLSLTASFKTASTGGGTDQGGNTDQGGGGSLGD